MSIHNKNDRKWKILDISNQPANVLSFEKVNNDKSEQITVADYFKREYKALQ